MTLPAPVTRAEPSSSARAPRHLSPIRFREGEWEFRCESCSRKQQAAFWPLTLEFWDPRVGMQMCRACKRLERRLAEAARLRRETAEQRRARIDRMRAYRAEIREVARIKRQVRSETERERKRAAERARRANETPEHRARRLAYLKDWKLRNPERVRELRERYLSSEKGRATRHAQYLRRKAARAA